MVYWRRTHTGGICIERWYRGLSNDWSQSVSRKLNEGLWAVKGLGFSVQGLGFRLYVSGFGFRVSRHHAMMFNSSRTAVVLMPPTLTSPSADVTFSAPTPPLSAWCIALAM